jgi:hypothetical protein
MKKFFIIVAALALVSFATFAAAAEWNFYGSARMTTFSASTDKEYNGTAFDDKDTQWDMQGNSRIGAAVKAGDVGGHFELGIYGPTASNGDNERVRTRMMFGTWNFGAGTLLVGQSYTPTFIPLSNQVYMGDADLFGWGGMIGSSRQPMIQVSFSGLKIALVRPNVVGMAGFADTDTKLPKIEASYAFKFGPAAFTVFGGMNSYDVVDATDKGWTVDSNLYGLAVSFGTGPFFVKADIWAGSNVNYYGYGFPMGVSAFTVGPAWIDPEDYDVDYMGYLLVAGFKLNDMVTFEAGYGSVSSEANRPGVWEDDARSYYVQATIALAKGVSITPEFGCIDRQDIKNGTSASTEQGKLTYFGAKWQINF